MRAWIVGGAVAVVVLAACSGSSTQGTPAGTDGGSQPSSGALGAGCVPGEELDSTFQGFSVEDVSVENNAPSCASSLCLINHFQGRTTCPYGQTAPGKGPAGPAGSIAATEKSEDGCIVPGKSPSGSSASWQVTATDVSVAGFSAGAVPPQITGAGAGDRTANKTVYCSCRCANADGKTDDGQTYCACPADFTCTQVISSIGSTDSTTAGAYCVLSGTTYSAAVTDSANVCDATITDSTAAGYCPVQR